MLFPLSDQKLQLQHSIRLETHLFFRKSEKAQKMPQRIEFISEGAYLFLYNDIFPIVQSTVSDLLKDSNSLGLE